MKATLRIPTQESYAFIEVEVEGEPVEIVEKYDELTGLVKPQIGDDQSFRNVLDRYLTEGTVDANAYDSLSPQQKDVVQTIKRSLKRIQRKNGEN